MVYQFSAPVAVRGAVRVVLLVTVVTLLAGCAASGTGTTSSAPQQSPVAKPVLSSKTYDIQPRPDRPVYDDTDSAVGLMGISPSWNDLVARLKMDMPGAPVEDYFADLPAFSTMPMAVKIKELYTAAFVRKKPDDDGKPKPPPSGIYKGVVTQANMIKCQDFLEVHKAAFDVLEQRYGVPREVVVSLLMVETKLGTYLGNVDAFWSLASMAAANTPDKVRSGLTVDITPDKEAWLAAKLEEKSSWAYKELKALINHCAIQTLNPKGMPGSVYGAVGICQFMPTNLSHYADDGNGDGIIDLFTEADAIVSVGKYLTKHGWQDASSVEHQRKTLRRYNNSTRYANTILALAYSLRSDALKQAPPNTGIALKK